MPTSLIPYTTDNQEKETWSPPSIKKIETMETYFGEPQDVDGDFINETSNSQ